MSLELLILEQRKQIRMLKNATKHFRNGVKTERTKEMVNHRIKMLGNYWLRAQALDAEINALADDDTRKTDEYFTTDLFKQGIGYYEKSYLFYIKVLENIDKQPQLQSSNNVNGVVEIDISN